MQVQQPIPFFEVYVDLGGLHRWRFVDGRGKALVTSRGGFNSEASAVRSLKKSEPARDLGGRFRLHIAR
jgi:uncharacterized protein YegP (UPF0339 family)